MASTTDHGPAGGESVELMGLSIDRLDDEHLLDEMFGSMHERGDHRGDDRRGRGGWVVTVDVDVLRRQATDPELRALYGAADLRVAAGMQLLWASRVQGEPLPARIAGTALALRIASRAADEGRSIVLVGGDPGAAEGAEAMLRRRYPGLDVRGLCPGRVSLPASDDELDALAEAIASPSVPDVVLLAYGSPKQEYVARGLRERVGEAWLVGVGPGLGLLAGQIHDAPPWMHELGVDWIHRLAKSPRRLAKRYLVDDLPFAARMFASAAAARISRRR
jgi:N-acetylglucosaminyldiphosphoundecaprenol N-acetyl-beta-D-mannosaminyltransferase